MGESLAILALVLFSSNIILTKVASERLDLQLGFLISVAVNVLFSLVLLIIQFFFRESPFQWNSFGFFFFMLSGFFNTYLGRWFFFDAIAILGPSKASTFQVSNPLFTVIIAWMFLGERLSVLDFLSIVIVLLGLFLVSYSPKVFIKKQVSATQESTGIEPHLVDEASKPPSKWKIILKSGIFLAFFSTVSYAIGNVLRGAAIQEWNEPILGGLIGAAMGLFLHYITSSHKKNLWAQLKQADRKGFFYYLMSGVITITAQICVIASMRYIPVSIATLITLSTPLLVTPLSYYLLKNQEAITFVTVSGIALVLSGISMIILI
ncbi:DMT family transporter [Fictibacillus enclensis]|uniref:DMT family transporter n=1 Tax=Fictibacillus enclensis TaxID=1017270 RepID=UPI0025A19D77|nr:DMT family transporter [Fictibacillus enclensis]MDM5196707.1 DMT family transporter [Fictibacillus enclensis]